MTSLNASIFGVLLSAVFAQLGSGDYFAIRVVDATTGRGVPLVELSTVNSIRMYTDSAGRIAFYEPGLMNSELYFHVSSHGYEYPKDGFGFRGVRLQVVPGTEATIQVKRVNIAERLYRLTGSGIYRDSVLLGRSIPLQHPLLNGQVMGSDSVVNAIYRGKIYWFWGDTNRPSYPLGNFQVSGATSRLPDQGGLDPAEGVDFEYFVDDHGFAKPMAPMPGEGPTWIDGLVALEDVEADAVEAERLFASYVKVKPPLEIYRRGLARFNDRKRQFEPLVEFDLRSPLFPSGHAMKCEESGTAYIYFANPYPVVRVQANSEHLRELSLYEAYTCLVQGTPEDALKVERTGGELVFSWKKHTPAFTPELQEQLIRQGLIDPREALYQLRDEDGRAVRIHRGSVYWNAFRKRWILIGVQRMGSSPLGEIWYSEAEQKVGPWKLARKIVTHDRYSFYNPKQHPMFDQRGGRWIYFEGTYTHSFSGSDQPTPRYDYNQIMYRLDLADPRLRLSAESE